MTLLAVLLRDPNGIGAKLTRQLLQMLRNSQPGGQALDGGKASDDVCGYLMKIDALGKHTSSWVSKCPVLRLRPYPGVACNQISITVSPGYHFHPLRPHEAPDLMQFYSYLFSVCSSCCVLSGIIGVLDCAGAVTSIEERMQSMHWRALALELEQESAKYDKMVAHIKQQLKQDTRKLTFIYQGYHSSRYACVPFTLVILPFHLSL